MYLGLGLASAPCGYVYRCIAHVIGYCVYMFIYAQTHAYKLHDYMDPRGLGPVTKSLSSSRCHCYVQSSPAFGEGGSMGFFRGFKELLYLEPVTPAL